MLAVLLAAVFPGIFQGKVISPAEILLQAPPWRTLAPEGFVRSPHTLMSDVITAFHPYYVLTQRALENGEWPLWNNLELWGMPLLANCQSAPFYPPRLLHSFLDIPWATTFYILLKLWLCGMMAYVCGRAIGLGTAASRFLSIAWMLSSYNQIWCNWSLPDVSAWVPVLFLAVDSVFRGKYRRGFFTGAIGGSMILLAGHPETAFTFCLGMGVYFLLRLLFERRQGRELWMPVAVMAGAWCIAILVCASTLLPFAEYLVNSSTFFDRREEARQSWYRLSALVNLFMPRFFGTTRDGNFWGHINSNLASQLYTGVAVGLTSALLLVRSARQSPPSPARALFQYRGFDASKMALLLSGIFSLLLAFNAPTIGALHRLPVMHAALFCYHSSWPIFVLPMLGAFGLDYWLKEPRRPRDLAWTLLPILIGAALVAFLYDFNAGLIAMTKLNGYINRQMVIAAVLTAAALALLAVRCFARHSRAVLAGHLLALVLAADLLYANRGLNPTTERRLVFPPTALTSYLQSLGPHRFGMADGDIPSGLMAPYGLEDWLGYDGLYPARIIRLIKKLGPDIWNGMEPVRSIAYFLNNPELQSSAIPEKNLREMEFMGTFDGVNVFRNPNALPRAFLVGRARVVPAFDDMIQIMRTGEFDPRKEVLLERETPQAPAPAADGAPLGSAEVLERKMTRVEIKVSAQADCYLVFSDSYYPGWKATVDGQAVPIFSAYYAWRGIVIPKGAHTVVFSYMPWTFTVGMAISIAALTSLSLYSLYLLAAKRPRPATP